MTAVKSIEHQEHLPAPVAAVTPMEMLDRAVQSGAGIETLEKLMALQERWEANQGRKAFDAAIAQAKAEIGPILKNREVDFEAKNGGRRTNYRHEDLAQIANQVNPILSKYGLSYRFKTEKNGNEVLVTCIVSHRDGYSEPTSLPGPLDTSGNKNGIQAIGSTVTFLQRYTLKAALGLAVSNDDDGNNAKPQPENISPAQLKDLQELIDAANADTEWICKHHKIGALPDMNTKQFHEAVLGLKQRIAHAKKQQEARNA